MKALLIMMFVGFGWCAMAQQTGDSRTTITFDSPEPTVVQVEDAKGQINEADRTVILSPEPQVLQVKTSTPVRPKVEFTSPEPQSVRVDKRDDE